MNVFRKILYLDDFAPIRMNIEPEFRRIGLREIMDKKFWRKHKLVDF